ncbi:MAG: hypothetical protein KDA32_09245 [Phycisphaerales bacterium]|nr:hypothetical protein [Phycisphaerales bacterium]
MIARTSRVGLAGVFIFASLLGGCVPTTTDSNGNVVPTVDNGTNDSFNSATALAINNDAISLTGSIVAGGDIDMYEIGALSAGDRVVIDVRATSGDLDGVAALFDTNQNMHAFNDDRASDSSNLNPLIDVVVRRDDKYFVGIVAFPGGATTGNYTLTVTITRGVGVPNQSGQIVFLDWNGGQNLRVKNVGTFNLPAFSATDVGINAALTDALKARVAEIIRDRFTGFKLNLMNSDDDAIPAAAHSTVFFGGANTRAFAISEQIDTENEDPSDNAIVFTGSFLAAFQGIPSFEQMATALGNTVSHEVGHLLGLVHTKDCAALMDTSCGNNALLRDQAFKRAQLDDSVFPIGFQDALQLVGWAIGTTDTAQ